MLVLTRKLEQQVKIGVGVTITVLEIKGKSVRLGIQAPRETVILRAELAARKSLASGCSVPLATHVDAVGTTDCEHRPTDEAINVSPRDLEDKQRGIRHSLPHSEQLGAAFSEQLPNRVGLPAGAGRRRAPGAHVTAPRCDRQPRQAPPSLHEWMAARRAAAGIRF